MVSLRVFIVLPLTLLAGSFVLACSGADDDGRGAPAAAGDGAAAETGVAYTLKQTFDMGIAVTSPVFSETRRIPKTHACDPGKPKAGTFLQGKLTTPVTYANTSPPLEWTGVPEGTRSIALILDSDEVPDTRRVHWVIWNIPADATGLAGAVATTTEVLAVGAETRHGVNGRDTIGYSGPCPVAVTLDSYTGTTKARPKVVFAYMFHVYALDTQLDLDSGSSMNALLRAMDGHVLAGGEIKGEYVARKQVIAY